MKPVSEATTESILAAAKKEFLTYGFSEGSLHRICSECQVSTHTIYTRFGSKEGLFDALVKETADGLFSIYSSSVNKAYLVDSDEVFDVSDEGSDACLKYVYEHFDEMKLILKCSAGSKYERYLDQFVQKEEQYYLDFIRDILKNEVKINPFFFHVLSQNSMNLFYEVVDHDLTFEEAADYLRTNIRFTQAGLMELLGLSEQK